MERTYNAATRVIARFNGLGQRARPLLDRLFSRWVPIDKHDQRDFAIDAEWARLQEEPLRARALVWWTFALLVVLTIWAAFAEIDEITRGDGKVIPSLQLQVLQSVDGGVVSEILVHEGDVVEKDQVLLNIDPTRFQSSVQENRAQYLALVAKAARLRAMAEQKPFVAPPEVEKQDPALVEHERALYQARKSELDANLGIARQQLAQRNQELVELKARRDQAAQGLALTNQELTATKPLLASGAVSEVDLLRLERDVTRYRGERDQAAAQITRIQAAIGEASRKIEEVELKMRNEAGAELSETMGKLAALSEGRVALSDRVKRAALRSPMKGTVKRLLVNTVGGVVMPGKDAVEIVPLEDSLLLEAKVSPKDIAFLRPGQKAMVKFTAYDFAIYGGLEATLEQIGADTIVDDKGNAFYVVRVRTVRSTLGKQSLPIIPGMVAEVDILTGKKSVLSYLLKPVLRAKYYALSER
jgi:membrane fusion protein, adhesin transport system